MNVLSISLLSSLHCGSWLKEQDMYRKKMDVRPTVFPDAYFFIFNNPKNVNQITFRKPHKLCKLKMETD